MSKGISYIELILVMAIITIIAGLSTPFLSRFILSNNTETTLNITLSSIRKAQNYSMDSKNSETWGICKTNSSIKLYSGTCDTSGYSEEYVIPNSINITGLNEVSFNERGEPAENVNINISSAIRNIQININQAGGIETL